MSKTQTQLTREEVEAELQLVKAAVDKLNEVVLAFKKKYDPDTVCLNSFLDDIDTTMSEIEADMDETFE